MTKTFDNGPVQLYQADARALPLAGGSVDCCVTSPPYWGLRDYGLEGGIGLEPTLEEYIANMVAVFREVRRVLRKDGVLFLNMGDAYWSGANARPYGNVGTKSQDSQGSDCPSNGLCGACQDLQTHHNSHSDDCPLPESPSYDGGPSPAHTVSLDLSPDSLGSYPRLGTGQCDSAIPGQMPSLDRAHEHLDASAGSTPVESSQQLPADSRPSDNSLVALGGVDSSSGDVPMFADKSGDSPERLLHKEGNARPSEARQIHTQYNAGYCSRCGASLAPKDRFSHFVPQLKPKDLIGLPWRVAFALQADGWWLRSDIIWSKPNPMPESVIDRPTRAHEYMFLLAKSERYHYDAQAIRMPAAPASNARWNQNTEGQNGSTRANGGARTNRPMKAVGGPQRTDKQRGHSRRHAGFNDRWDAMERADQLQGGANRRTVWEIATRPYPEAHFATFPEALVEPCILAGAPEGGTVLDPFIGTGTTCAVAQRLGRRAIGVDLSAEYLELAAKRVGAVPLPMALG